MSSVRKQDKPVAILCSDLHLSLRPPRARASEEDWFAAMQRILDQLKGWKDKYQVPIVCAGDVFDFWRSPPELINFACKHLPQMYSIPGQHDLPYHSIAEIRKSAYWTLVEANVLIDLSSTYPDGVVLDTDVVVYGFPFGTEVRSCPREDLGLLSVAVIHEYTWAGKWGYANAPKESKLSSKLDSFAGYDVVVIGDNHQGFILQRGKITVCNCGAMMRRTTDQNDYVPFVGLLHRSGHVEPLSFDISRDVLTDVKGEVGLVEFDITPFFNELSELQHVVPDFKMVLQQAAQRTKVSDGVQRVLDEELDDGKPRGTDNTKGKGRKDSTAGPSGGRGISASTKTTRDGVRVQGTRRSKAKAP